MGVFINNEILNEENLPEKDYFIWFDDSEHALQLLKEGKILCWPELRVNHNVFNGSNGFSWKNFYGTRNKLHAYKKHFGLGVFYFHCFRIYLTVLFSNNKNMSKLLLASIKSAKNGNLGLHEVYNPSWRMK